MPKLERFQAFLRLAVAAGPLLGLIGTVVGMIELFGAQQGSITDPLRVAQGISVALYNTGFGLAVAMPALLFHRHLQAQVDALIIDMEQQALRFVDQVTRGQP